MEKNISEEMMIMVRLGLEYGVVFTETARNLGIEVTKELVEKLEKVVNGEFPIHTPEHLAVNMLPNIMAALEPKDEVELARIKEKNAMAKGTKKGGMKSGKGSKSC